MSVCTSLVAATYHQKIRYTYPVLATTYLTWSAMIWTAFLMEEQAVAASIAMIAGPTHGKTAQEIRIGEYRVGENPDENLYGHPEIRY